MINTIIQGDSREKLKTIKSKSVRCCVTSPPYYGLRDYGVDGQIGLEQSPEEFVQQMVDVFREVKRILTDDGTLWLNLGDSYAGSGKGFGATDHGKLGEHANDFLPKPNKISNGLKPKDLIGIPWRVAFALQADGWYLRSDIIWHKPNCMPESVTDRPTKSHEYIFLLSKSERYYYDYESIKEYAVDGDGKPPNGSRGVIGSQNTGNRNRDEEQSFPKPKVQYERIEKRNKRTVWNVNTASYSEAHFATFPAKLIEPCILAGTKLNDIVLDQFFGAGTTGLVALQNGRNFIGVELNPEYIEIADRRLSIIQPVINF